MADNPAVSVAIPVYNEASVLPELYRRTSSVLSDLAGGPHELVFVDDGSTDGSWEVLEALAGLDERVRVVRLSRNFGHQAALTAALQQVQGDVVVVMDGDLQDTPETIPLLVEKYLDGNDVVYAIRHRRKEGVLLRACFALFYRLISVLANIPLPQGTGDFALMSRRVVEQLNQNRERNRYLRGLRAWVGFRQTGVVVERAARYSGRSKYSITKLFKLAFDGIFSFSVVPLRMATLLGAITIAGSLVYGVYAVLVKVLLEQSPAGFTALILSITFLAGVQLLFLGVIGEYVGRIYEEVKRRPLYVVDKVLGDSTTPTRVEMPDQRPLRQPVAMGHGRD